MGTPLIEDKKLYVPYTDKELKDLQKYGRTPHYHHHRLLDQILQYYHHHHHHLRW